MAVDKLAYMTPPYKSDIRAALSARLAEALCMEIDRTRVHLPARNAHASYHPPQNADFTALAALDFGLLYGESLVQRVCARNGWLLFDFSPAFFSALVEQINAGCSAPEDSAETHAQNRMAVLSRHGGTGCPNHPAFQRALLVALSANESAAAYRKAERAAETLFHTVPPCERAGLSAKCGAFGGAMLRLLSVSR